MESLFRIDAIDQVDESVTITLRRELIAPVADALIKGQAGKEKTRYALGSQLHSARRVIKDQVDIDDIAEFEAVSFTPNGSL